MNPPRMVSKKVEPRKFVRVFAEVEMSKCITSLKYRTIVDMFATNPMFSKVPNTIHAAKTEEK